MKSIYKQYESTWFGWPVFFKDEVAGKTIAQIEHKLESEKCKQAYIDKDDLKLYYSGFSNKTLWPL